MARQIEFGSARISIQAVENGMAITILCRKDPRIILLIGMLVPGVLFGVWVGSFFIEIVTTMAREGIFAFGMFLGGFFFLWLTLLVCSLWKMVRMALWSLAGFEEIQINAHTIVVEESAPLLNRQRIYLLQENVNLRVVPNSEDWMMTWLMSKPVGALAFDVGSRTMRIGAQLNEGEANQILLEIAHSFPAIVAPLQQDRE